MYVLNLFSHVQLFETPWNVAQQAPLSMGFSRQEYWSGLPCPFPRDLPSPGIEPESLKSPALAGGFFTTSAPWEAPINIIILNNDLILCFFLFATTVFWNPVLLLEISFSSRTHQLKQIYSSPFLQSLLKCQPFPVHFSVLSHQLPTLPSHFLICVCLFCPASKSKGEKPRNLLMWRGGQRERLVTFQGVRSEVEAPRECLTLFHVHYTHWTRSIESLLCIRHPARLCGHKGGQGLSLPSRHWAERRHSGQKSKQQITTLWDGLSSRSELRTLGSLAGGRGWVPRRCGADVEPQLLEVSQAGVGAQRRGTEAQFRTQTRKGPEGREVSPEALQGPVPKTIPSSMRL